MRRADTKLVVTRPALTTLANMTPPTERNVQDKRGVMAWTYEMKPGEEREIRTGFRLRWPGDRELVLEPQGGLRPMVR